MHVAIGLDTNDTQIPHIFIKAVKCIPDPTAPLWWFYPLPQSASQTHLIPAEKGVQVPEMAESITEGTLKQWSKSELAS